jgi:hypothetical protein
MKAAEPINFYASKIPSGEQVKQFISFLTEEVFDDSFVAEASFVAGKPDNEMEEFELILLPEVLDRKDIVSVEFHIHSKLKEDEFVAFAYDVDLSNPDKQVEGLFTPVVEGKEEELKFKFEKTLNAVFSK